MRIVDFGFVIGVALVVIGAISFGIWSIVSWSFVHDKLRSERKQDEKESRKNGR